MDTPVAKEQALEFARLPRSRSTSDMLDAATGSPNVASHRFRDNARERVDVDGLRNLAEFLRTTGPPSNFDAFPKDFLGVSTPSQNWRRSMRILKKEWKAESQTQSLSRLPNGVVPRTSTDGHHYIAISMPAQNDRFSRFRSRSYSSTPPDRGASSQEWPERISSRKGWGRPMMASTSVVHSDNMGTRSSARKEAYLSSLSARMPAPRDVVRTLPRPSTGFSSYQSAARGRQFSADHALVDGSGATAHIFPANSAPGDVYQRSVAVKATPKCSLAMPVEGRATNSQLSLATSPTSTRCLTVDIEELTQSTLAAPQDLLLPESPGFPKMLAAMTFPSPPLSPYLETSVSPGISRQINIPTPPTVRPRTSSKRAYTSNAAPTASLDELVMRPSRPFRQPEPVNIPYTSPVSETYVATSLVITTASDKSLVTDFKSRPSSGASSPLRTGYDSITMTSDGVISRTQSLISDITAMTSSAQGSSTTLDAALAPRYHEEDLESPSLTCHNCKQGSNNEPATDRPTLRHKLRIIPQSHRKSMPIIIPKRSTQFSKPRINYDVLSKPEIPGFAS
ncbi:hypothetical protein F4677DRAFT_306910 [Hypoxylon crocopeplum]|nr:hypothetical protein F4677DRAFT_306910 [Hypoxylon crocopeplum]